MTRATRNLKRAHRLCRLYDDQSFKAWVRERAQHSSPHADYKQEALAWLERKRAS
jgi:hypothetical protein